MSNPIRILHVVDNLGKGGLENGLANLIGRLDPARFEHTVLVMRHIGMTADRLRGRARLIHLDKQPGASRFQLPDMLRVIHRTRPHVVHSRNWGAIEAVIAARLLRVSGTVHSEHGLDGNAALAPPKARVWFRRFAFELADRVLCVSRQLRDHHAKQTGFAASKVTVVHNGVDTLRFRPDPDLRRSTRAELGLSPDDFSVVAVGNLTPVKDHMTLLRATGEFHRRARGPWRLVLYGCGPEEPRLKQFLAGQDAWRNRVTFAGLSDRVPEMLNAFDAYTLTSLTEGVSNSLLEAMATGLPAIVTNTGGNPEVVTHGQSGLLFDAGGHDALAEHLLSVQNDRALSKRLSLGALSAVRDRFSVNAMVAKYADVYESVSCRHDVAAAARRVTADGV